MAMKRLATCVAAFLVSIMPVSASAWGSAGHRMIGEAALGGLPDALPDFLKTSQAIADVGEYSRELDRSKGAGRLHDQNLDPGHFMDVMDDGTILGGPKLTALPGTREDFETALRASSTSSWKAGWLFYSIVERQQQLTKDLAYWRVLKAALGHEKNPTHKAWLMADQKRREGLILANLGQLSHFVGDGAQPLHVTIHFNGWGDFPNPENYTRARIHTPFEGEFVAANVQLKQVREAMSPPTAISLPLDGQVTGYLAETAARVVPLYALEKRGGFTNANPEGVRFAIQRLAAGASELRNLLVTAWSDSSRQTVGWPAVSLADVESGKVDAYLALYGND